MCGDSVCADAPGADKTRRPVARAEALDADDAGRARCVYEFVAANRDPDVRGARLGRREENQIARLEILGPEFFSNPELLPDPPREGDAVLREDVSREAAAVEATGTVAAVAVGLAPQAQGGPYDRLGVGRGVRPGSAPRPAAVIRLRGRIPFARVRWTRCRKGLWDTTR